jgi:mono/diheme cytochrome c family protein
MSAIHQLQTKGKPAIWSHSAQAVAVGVLFCGLLPLAGSSVTAAPNGADIFKNNCAACHANGGNIVDPKKPLKGSKKLATKAVFKDLLSKSAGAMPAFPKIVEDDPSLSALYEYCKSLK